MRRAKFCKIVDVDEGFFKSLRTRGYLPFVSETETTDGAQWQRFTLDDALRLRLALDLAEDGGISPDDAAKAVWNSIGSLPFKNPFGAADQNADLFIAIERWRHGETLGASHYAGTLREIAAGSEERAMRDRSDGIERTRLMLANVSRAARFIMRQAAAEGELDA